MVEDNEIRRTHPPNLEEEEKVHDEESGKREVTRNNQIQEVIKELNIQKLRNYRAKKF